MDICLLFTGHTAAVFYECIEITYLACFEIWKFFGILKWSFQIAFLSSNTYMKYVYRKTLYRNDQVYFSTYWAVIFYT